MKTNMLPVMICAALYCFLQHTSADHLEKLDEYLYDHVKSEDIKDNLRAAQDLLADSAPIKVVFRRSFEAELRSFVDLLKVIGSEKCTEVSQNIVEINRDAINEEDSDGDLLRRINKIVEKVEAERNRDCA